MFNSARSIIVLVTTTALCMVTIFSYGTRANTNDASAIQVPNNPDADDPDVIARGHYLSIAGNCQECHTTKNGLPFAGGRELKTPFGKILSANITPDRDTGIGAWSADQFYTALHRGVEPDGTHLYPAFPYEYFTKMARTDADALYAYLRSVPPVKEHIDRNQLPFPFRIRGLMVLWNALFFKAGEYRIDLSKSGEWNRGAYLVQALGHCGGCHTPTNMFGAPKRQKFLQGSAICGWLASDLTNNKRTGLGAWSDDDIAEFLKTGRNIHAAATVDMGGVISASTSRLQESDLKAIANYLHTVPARNAKAFPHPDAQTLHIGEAIFTDECSACHGMNGEGVAQLIPPLKANANVQQHDAQNVIRFILWGVRATATDARPSPSAMPSFAWKLDDEQVAAVASYIRNAWENTASRVSDSEVKKQRATQP